MRGDEARWGYVVAGALIVVAIINLTVTHGPGAAKHPNTTLALVGLVASIALVAIIRTHHRFIVPLAAIGAAFFVTLPSQVPNSVRSVHIVALIIPVVYAFVLTQRQRRATTAQAQARRASLGPDHRHQGDGDPTRGRRPAGRRPQAAPGAQVGRGTRPDPPPVVATPRPSPSVPAAPLPASRPTRAANGGGGPPTPDAALDT